MIPATTVSKIYSTLGNNNSLVPLAIKDVANSAGITTGSYITGDKLEGKDRFIDEFGTQAIWLFGLPVYKKIADLSMYKMFGIDSKFDVRNLKDKEVMKKTIEYAPTKEIKESLENIAKNQKLTKNLALAKFGLATALTIASYAGLTKYRQNYRKNAAKKEVLKTQEELKNKTTDTSIIKPDITTFGNKNKSNKPSFKGGIQDFMFSPVKNLMIVDGAITTERFAYAESKQELAGYIVKEGGIWAFMYLASKPIQNFLENQSDKKHNKSIALDARVIESEELKKAMGSRSIQKAIEEFPTNAKDAEIYDFVHKNPDNFIVQMAKKSDIIDTMKDSEQIDTRKFIDTKKLIRIKEKIEKLDKQFMSSGENIDTFLSKVKTLKRGAIIGNILACVGALGIVVPAIMVGIRKLDKDNSEYKVMENAKKELGVA
ncbi:MAG: hypothetical protein R3Y28_03120 [Candidatus Gastranaerophilales bacterium]